MAAIQPDMIETVEMHTGGEPLRIILKGCPEIEGKTILDKRRFVKEKLDSYRAFLMLEPRGHKEMYGALLVSPDHPDAHIAVLFTHNEGYSTMCGHGVIALARFAVDYGYVKPTPPETTVQIQCPCGLVGASVSEEGTVRFQSVPSFAFATEQKTTLKAYGEITYDVGFGGTFYALAEARQFGLDLSSATEEEIRSAGRALTDHLRPTIHLEHPESNDLAFLYGTIITDGLDSYRESDSTKNVCIFAEGQVDRSPTGSGVQARLAVHYHKKLIEIDQKKKFVNALTGSEFIGSVLKEVQCGRYQGVQVEVAGKAYYTGSAKFWREAGDPLKNGFWLH